MLAPAGVRTAVTASILGRFALGMTGLALLIMVRSTTGSYGDAGLVSASYAVAFAAGSPRRARSADRRGPRRVLLLTGVLQPVALGLVVVLAEVGSPLVLVCLAAVLVGFAVPPLGAVMRALWGGVVPAEQLASAFSLESVLVEICFVAGPLLVAAVTAVVHPAAGVVATAAFAGGGALWLAANPVVRRVVPVVSGSAAGPLVSPVVRACLLNVLWIGTGFGTIEVGVLAFVDEHGHPRPVAGVVLAVWSLGSVLGGLGYGGLTLQRPAARQLPVLVAVVGVGAFLPVLAPGVVLLAVLLALAGSTIAPFSACNSVLISGAAPPGTVTEAFAWNSSMIFGGAALGTALGGALIDASSARAAFGATAVTGLLVLGSSLLCLRALRSTA